MERVNIEEKSKGTISNVSQMLSIPKVKRGLGLKLVITIVASLLISSPISAYLYSLIQQYVDRGIGVYINTLVTLIVTTTIISLIVRYMIILPLHKVEEAIKKASEGDLTVSIHYNAKDEIGRLSNSFNIMIYNLKDLMEKTNQTALKVTDYSKQLNTIAEENSKAIEHISSSIQDVNTAAENQAQSSSNLVHSAKEISSQMEQSSASIQFVSNKAISANEKAGSGNKMVTNTINQMNEIQKSTEETSKVIQSLEIKSQKIGEIVEIITQIAEQTNLLSLNASIEAARAGEHGKGFAVVANEVRKLAEQSAIAGDDIREIIKDIQIETKRAVDSMEQGKDNVENGIKMVGETGGIFKDILRDFEEVSYQVQEVSTIVEQVNQSSIEMVKMIENVAVTAEQASGSIQNVSASVEEQNASMEEIYSSVIELNKMANDLQSDINKFKFE